MKMIPVEKIKKFVDELKNTLNTLPLEDSDWDAFNRITDFYFGTRLNDIPDYTITKKIAIVWSIEDVYQVRPDLTNEQASAVLIALREDHDANMGINWEVLTRVADDLFPPTPPNTVAEIYTR